MSSKDGGESQLVYSKSDIIEIMIGNNTNENINERVSSFLIRHQIGLETSMEGSYFIFDSIDGMHYKCHKIRLNRVGLYIDDPDCTPQRISIIKPFINSYN